MIKNERQYRITKAQAEKFAQSLSEVEQNSVPVVGVHPLLHRAQTDALKSQLETLRGEIAAYENLRSGNERISLPYSLDELPEVLVKARIAAGLSQKELAEKLGLKEQQVQKYEATDYTSASLERVRAVVRALNVTVQKDASMAGR